MFSKLLIVASAIGMASAACPNSCSGHGTCGSNEVCNCFDGWGMGGQEGGDCSDRFCPYELAWSGAPDRSGSTHNYAECAGKGVCDRETGQCECFGGYEGQGCGRQSCPDDCSGHGTCEYMNELTFGTVFGDYYDGDGGAGNDNHYRALGEGGVIPRKDYSWDSDRSRACVCDGGWTGVNCASRMCPYGNDVMDLRSNTGNTAVSQIQTITLLSGGSDGGITFLGDAVTDFNGLSFSLTFTSKMNETYTTVPVQYKNGTATNLSDGIKNALLNLPNKVINGVAVSVVEKPHMQAALQILVTFTGSSVHGNQHLLQVNVNACGAGCTPRQDGIASKLAQGVNSTFTTTANAGTGPGDVSSVVQTQAADFNSFECGRRGKCDYETGLCSCFEGYTGEACTDLTALV